MGFIKAFAGAVGGTFADQWEDYLIPMEGVPATAGVYPAVPKGTNAGRGANTQGSENIISNGSKILVPEGTALITMQDGAITGLITEPGGFLYTSSDPNSKSIWAGDGIEAPLIAQSWERFKFGGQPATTQMAFYVNLKEIPNNKFGTQSEIYWDDAYLNAQVGAITRGTYTLRIIDPILFIKNFVPANYLSDQKVFDFADMDNDAGAQLFNEVVGCLSAAFSNYTNDPSKGNRITRIQGDQIGFAQSLSKAVEDSYQWKTDRGIEIVKVAIQAIEYDEDTRALLSDVKKADALSGARGNSFMQQSVARGMQASGENGNSSGMAFMGMNMNAAGNVMSAMQQPAQPIQTVGLAQSQAQTQGAGQQVAQPQNVEPMQGVQSQNTPPMQGAQPQNTPPMQGTQPQSAEPMQGIQAQSVGSAQEEDPYEKLSKFKKMLDEGLITQEEYDEQKKKILGV